MYTSLQLVLPFCINNSNNHNRRCSDEGGITGRLRYLQVPYFSVFLTFLIERFQRARLAYSTMNSTDP